MRQAWTPPAHPGRAAASAGLGGGDWFDAPDEQAWPETGGLTSARRAAT